MSDHPLQPLVRAKKPHGYRMIGVDLSEVYHCTRAVLRTWVRGGHGSRIVNIASVAGERGDIRPEEVAYLVSFPVLDRASFIARQVMRIDGGLYM